jgi:hypothetical protein
MIEAERPEVTEETRAEDEADSHRVGASGREPTADEEEAADAAAESLEESGELKEVAERHSEMRELGANVKGEGQLP